MGISQYPASANITAIPVTVLQGGTGATTASGARTSLGLGTLATQNGTIANYAPLASPTFTGTVSGITSTMVGLGNVDNTSDANKPVSTAQQTALNLKANLASPTFTGNPLAPTPSPGDNDTSIATTAFVTAAIAAYVGAQGSILSCPVNNSVLATATGTVYTSPGNDGTPLSVTSEGAVSFPMARAGTLRNLYIRTGSVAQINTAATVITIRKNGVDTAVTITLTQTVNTTSSDLTHSVAFAAGDLLTVSLATTGLTATSTSIAAIVFEFA